MNARVVSLFMHQNVLVSLTIPSGDNKELFFFGFFSTTLWFHELLMTGLTQRRTDSLNEHKMT